MTRIRTLVALGVLLLIGAAVPAAQALPGLTIGFSGPVLDSGSATATSQWIPDAVREGAGVVRLDVQWAQVAPKQPSPGSDASNPSNPAYGWTRVDKAVRQLTAAGLKILINIEDAPTWAEGPDPPASAFPGAWRPSASQFGAFAAAAAKRYDGDFPDPLEPGRSLPRVSNWQGWNEPNLAIHLGPQWVRAGNQWVAESPIIFRGLMNAFYSAVKGVSKSNLVVLGGTAPYGDPPGGIRIPPVEFYRDVFCLSGAKQLKPTGGCSDPVHFDAVDHHPYGVGGPLTPALNADDVAVADIYKIARVLHAAERSKHVLPQGTKQLWVTEIGWDSDPPDPQGVPIQREARWYEQAMYVLWRQGVDTVLFLQIVDQPPIPNYAETYQGGLYFLNGKPKPAAVAFRFPFVTRRLNHGSVQAWGRSPQSGTLTIEKQQEKGWRTLKRLSVRNRQVFQTAVALRGKAVLRARVGGQTSLTWTES